MIMKKQELIHLHRLLVEVRNHYEHRTGNTVEHAAYEDLGIQPISIQKSKTDHKVAVFAVLKAINSEMGAMENEQPVLAAD